MDMYFSIILYSIICIDKNKLQINGNSIVFFKRATNLYVTNISSDILKRIIVHDLHKTLLAI